MLYLLKRHPIPISAFFRHSLVLTFAFPPAVLEPRLSKGLVLDLFRGYTFLAVALVQTERLRPSFLPAVMGRDFFLSGYRILTRFDSGSHSRRGLRILRSDTDHKWMVRACNLLTHYNYRLCHATLEEREQEIHWTILTPRAEADFEVVAHVADKPAILPGVLPLPLWPKALRDSNRNRLGIYCSDNNRLQQASSKINTCPMSTIDPC